MRCPRFLWISLGPLKEGTQSSTVPRKITLDKKAWFLKFSLQSIISKWHSQHLFFFTMETSEIFIKNDRIFLYMTEVCTNHCFQYLLRRRSISIDFYDMYITILNSHISSSKQFHINMI